MEWERIRLNHSKFCVCTAIHYGTSNRAAPKGEKRIKTIARACFTIPGLDPWKKSFRKNVVFFSSLAKPHHACS
jgi:hypothetical protein